MTTTVYVTRIDVWMAIYAHVIIALAPIHILSSSLTLTLVQNVSSQTKVQTQQGPAKGGSYWYNGVSVATVLVLRSFSTHTFGRYFQLYTIFDLTYRWVHLLIPTTPRAYIYALLSSRAWGHTPCVCMDAFVKWIRFTSTLTILTISTYYPQVTHSCTLLPLCYLARPKCTINCSSWQTTRSVLHWALVLPVVSVSVLVYYPHTHSFSLTFPCSTHSTHHSI